MRSAQQTGGRERADLLNKLALDASLVVTQITVTVEGVADLLQVAESDREGKLNVVPTATLVRSALETHGQVDWMLDNTIDGFERARRYLTWRFDDLKQLRWALRNGADESDEYADAVVEVDAEEADLIASAERIGLSARHEVVRPNGNVEPARLSDASGNLKMPSYGKMVSSVTNSVHAYAALSGAAHGQRYSAAASVAPNPETGEVRFRGSLIPTPKLTLWAWGSVAFSGLKVCNWNGMPARKLNEHIRGEYASIQLMATIERYLNGR